MARRQYSKGLQDLCRNKACKLDTFSFFDLAAEVGSTTPTVRRIVADWEDKGLVKRLGKGAKNRMQFTVTERGKIKLPATARAEAEAMTTPERNMWTAMRMLKNFEPSDIAVNARTETLDVTVEEARNFCRMLLRGDQPYLRVRRTAIPGRREAAYQLIRDTGPMPPRECRVRAIFDDNLASFTYMPEPSQ